jgi:hypothetical protein
MRQLVACLALGMIAALPAVAAERLSGEQIRQAFEDNTVTGRYTNGNRPFSEFHHRDGRVSGHNRDIPNTDACWTVVPDGVCYYYGPTERRRTYCFDIERSGALIVIKRRPGGQINGLAAIEAGDPRGFSPSAAQWSCDGLISERRGSPALMATAR